jgi:hypothetical protein
MGVIQLKIWSRQVVQRHELGAATVQVDNSGAKPKVARFKSPFAGCWKIEQRIMSALTLLRLPDEWSIDRAQQMDSDGHG